MNIGSVQTVNIEQQMQDAYIDYAMSVIVARALPDARDGLKPVHRRILYAMYDMGLLNSTSHKKSARIVGEVLGKYHPHGDAAVYETMVRLAQDFSMRYMLVDGQGNFGSIDGDSAAAMRYTEARMAKLGEELLTDIQKNTVDFVENFDGSLEEPSVLPANFPALLVNGASGIAVGMSTNIPPHNLGEICDALVYMLSHWKRLDDVTIEDLMRFVQGPDFPTGGVIYRHPNSNGEEDTLKTAYATGRGKITVRAKVHIEDMGRGKSRIVVSELPYMTNKTSLIERIASLATSGKLEGITDLRDESDRQNPIRMIIELGRGVDSSEVLGNLFKLTPLQETFGIIMLALVNGQPRLLTLKQALRVYLEHRIEIVRRRSEFDLAKAKERAHILEGLLKALDELDEVISTIRKSRNVETARANLIKLLKISQEQAQAILDMQLRRLAGLERKKIQDEFKEKEQAIKYLSGLLTDSNKIRIVVAEELAQIKSEYNDRRRTMIADSAVTNTVSAEDFLVPEEDTWITCTVSGLIGRSYKHEPPRIGARDREPPRFIVESSTAHLLYVFTADGNCATIPAQQIPQVESPPDGVAVSSLCQIAPGDEITAIISMSANLETGFIALVSDDGQVKRIRLEDMPGATAKLFTVMNVAEGAKMRWAMYTTGENEIMLHTANAQAIRFSEADVRPTGLPSGGMRGVKLLTQRDRVVSAVVVQEGQYVWTISDDGIAKISPIEEYPTQGRAGGGVISMRLPANSLELAAATIGRQDDNILALTDKNKAKYMRVSLAEKLKRGRNGGDFVISLRENERVIDVVTYQGKLD